MILVTGAAGKTGRAVIRALAAHGHTRALRALVHRPDQIRPIQEIGATEVMTGDMRRPETFQAAVAGVRALIHVCPNMAPDEVDIGRSIIAAARAAGVGHLVYHSVLHPQAEAMPHHWQKMRVEEQLFESGLPFTILQPAAYLQNILASWDQILERGLYRVPYAVETRLGMVDLEDVAQAAALVVSEPGHVGATYELAGTEVLSQAEVAAVLQQQLGRPVRAQAVPLDEWEQRARAAGLGEYAIDTLLKMFRYYERYGFWGNPRVLAGLLGRPPSTLAAFIGRVRCSPS